MSNDTRPDSFETLKIQTAAVVSVRSRVEKLSAEYAEAFDAATKLQSDIDKAHDKRQHGKARRLAGQLKGCRSRVARVFGRYKAERELQDRAEAELLRLVDVAQAVMLEDLRLYTVREHALQRRLIRDQAVTGRDFGHRDVFVRTRVFNAVNCALELFIEGSVQDVVAATETREAARHEAAYTQAEAAMAS